MDLNELLYHHQVALIRDARTTMPGGLPSLSGHYARRIRGMRQKLGLVPWSLAGLVEPLSCPGEACR